ncbi:MAG: RNA methyltransferase [Thermoanaerobaculia bacterium]|nr:RNA methyltransferase [Thermoanaerobaculia bacterium]
MISSRQNAKLKDIRRLRRCKGDRALLEGPHLLEEALSADLPLEEVLFTPTFAATAEGRRLRELLDRDPTLVDEKLLAEVTDSETPQGALAIASLPRSAIDRIPQKIGMTYLYCDGIQDPGNLGALARVAEASGVVAGFSSLGSVHPNHPRSLRASAGSLLRLPWTHGADPEAVEDHLRGTTAVWVQLVAHGGIDLYEVSPPPTCVLVVGSEAHGVSPGVSQRCRFGIEIPLAAGVESLNAATAAAVVLFEFGRRRR